MLVRSRQNVRSPSPRASLEAMGVRPGDRLRLEEYPNGFMLRPRIIDPGRLAPLRDKLRRGERGAGWCRAELIDVFEGEETE